MAQQVRFKKYTVIVSFGNSYAANSNYYYDTFEIWAIDKFHIHTQLDKYYINTNRFLEFVHATDITIKKERISTFFANLFNKNPNHPICNKI